MKYLINSIPFYFLFPIYAAVFLLLLFYNIPRDLFTGAPNTSFYLGLIKFLAIVTLPNLLFLVKPYQMSLDQLFKALRQDPKHPLIIFGLTSLIIMLGPLDVYINGFKLLDPAHYTDLYGIGRYVRHITLLCWVLIPIAFVYIKKPLLKTALILYAILFPIMIIDRNRFLFSIYTLFFCMFLSYLTLENNKAKQKIKWAALVIFCLCLLVFAVIGKYRSGAHVLVPTSGTILFFEHYPLKGLFFYIPSIFQQIILYVTTPIFNFTTIVAEDFINTDFLESQFSPFHREAFPFYPEAPVLVKRYNVGTEFFPFLLWGKLPLVALAYAVFFSAFIGAYCLLKKYMNIFTFLIFLKFTYNALFMGFGPQFFIFYNLMFCALMLFLWLSSGLLSKDIVKKILDYESLKNKIRPFFNLQGIVNKLSTS